MKNPPFELTNQIVSNVAEIAELVGRVSAAGRLSASPTLRRSNRVKTVYGSLAIEQNALTLDQVTAVLNGKRVLAPPKDIVEIRNAFEIYERLDELDPYSVDDLLAAHGIMIRKVEQEAGEFRSRPVGIVNQAGLIVHFGPLLQYVPDAVINLLDWVRNSELPMLIRSCVFHYEFELIHPFADSNVTKILPAIVRNQPIMADFLCFPSEIILKSVLQKLKKFGPWHFCLEELSSLQREVVAMSVVTDLYRGLICPMENFGYSTDQIYLDLVADTQRIEDGLLSGLDEKEQKVYQTIMQSRVELQRMELERMFDYSFKLGIQFGAEIFKEN